MSSIGTGYDLSVTSYSPEGRLFQIEYAKKAVKNSGTAIGICCKDGVVLGVENIRRNRLLEEGSNSRISTVDRHVGLAHAGWEPDGKAIASKAKEEAKSYKKFYGSNIPTETLGNKVATYVHMYTCYWHLRPFGASSLIGGYSSGGPELFLVEPSGEIVGYNACAVGKGVQSARSELEKLKVDEMLCIDAVKEVARIIWKVHDFVKDKDFELELSWVCKKTEALHMKVPDDVKAMAVEYAKKRRREDEELSDDEEEKDDEGDTVMKD